MTTRTTTERFAPKDVARAGAIMPIDYDGDISVMRGRVRAEDLGEPDSGSRAPSPPLPSPPLPSPTAAKDREAGALLPRLWRT